MKRYPQCLLGTCCVPWNEDGSFAEQVFRGQIQHLLKNGTQHLYIFGSAGEGYAVTDMQFNRITEVFCEEMNAEGAAPMVGVISASLPTITQRIKWARELGVKEYQIALPCWGQCTFDEVRRFFGETCGEFDDCSFLHFNSPHAKRMVTADEYAMLADEFGNLVATKNIIDSVREVTLLLKKSPQLQHFFMEHGFALASILGLEAGWIIALASTNWQRANAFYQACMHRNIEQITGYMIELVQMENALYNLVGDQGHIDGVYDKIFCNIADSDFSLRLLPPYNYVSDETVGKYVAFLRNSYPQWIS